MQLGCWTLRLACSSSAAASHHSWVGLRTAGPHPLLLYGGGGGGGGGGEGLLLEELLLDLQAQL